MIRVSSPVILLFVLLINHVAVGQDLQISEVAETKSKVFSLIVEDSSSFYKISSIYKAKGTTFYLQRFHNLLPVYEGEIQTKLGDKTLQLLQVKRLNDRVTAFFVNQNKDHVDFLMQQYDTLCAAISEPEIFATFPLLLSHSVDEYSVEFSENGQFISAFLNYRDYKTGTDYLSFALFDGNMNPDYQDLLVSERADYNSSFSSWWLNNKGSILVSENVLAPKVFFQSSSNRTMDYVNIHILENRTRSQFRLVGLPNTYLSQLVCSLNENGRVEGTGIYCGENDHFRGVFCFKREANQSEVVVNTWDRKSNPELAAFDLGISRRKKLNRQHIRIYACNESKILATFSFDSSRFVVWERRYSLYNKTSVTYATRDVLILKLRDNLLTNAAVIPKIQHSFNDDGTNISTYLTIDSNKLVLFFNDESNNYDPSGNFTASVVESAELTRLAGVNLVQVKYDLETNVLERSVVFNETVFDLIAAPRYWVSSGKNNSLLLYFYFKNKERFAYWQF